MDRKMTEKINIGIIGTGFGENVHLPAFSLCDKFSVQGIVSRDPEKSEKASRENRLPKYYSSWKDMLDDQDIDAVSIATPPSAQAEIAIEAFSKGKAVLCEKPLSSDMASAVKMAEAAKKAGTANMVDFEFTELDQWKKALDIIKNGRIGTLRHITVNWNVETYANKTGLKNWKTDINSGGGALYTFVSHVFYYLEWFAGRIKGLQARICSAPGDTRTGDTLDMISSRFESGLPASIVVSTHSFLGNGHQINFYGDEGTLVLHNPTTDYISGFRLIMGTRDTNELSVLSSNEDPGQSSIDGRIAAVSGIVNKFAGWISTSSPAKPDLSDGLRVQALLEACRSSSDSGKWIENISEIERGI